MPAKRVALLPAGDTALTSPAYPAPPVRRRDWWRNIATASVEWLILGRYSRSLLDLCGYGVLLGNPRLRAAWRDQCRYLSPFLHEPRRQVAGLLRQHWRFQRRLEFRRNHRLSTAALQRHVHSFDLPQRAALERLLRTEAGSRILVSFHFGDYVYGLNTLLACEPPGRQVYVLSLGAGSAGYYHNLRAAFGQGAPGLTAELLHAEHGVASLSARLRRGNCTLVLFCDLPAEFGARVAVRFLGRRAWFSRGAATLALANRVPLLPVLCCAEDGRNRICVGPQIDTHHDSATALARRIGQVTQELVTFFETGFRTSPGQWRYLHRLPLYFTDAPGVAGRG